jgi:hypothetical protein
MMLHMFIGMFLFQYFISSYIMSNSLENITNSMGKIYMCTIMALFMVLLDMLMNKTHIQHIFIVLLLIFLTIYLYKIQFGVDDKNYIREMIEHHSMALLTSKKILEKTKNPAVINFATKIVVTQENEIEDMRYLLKSI